MKAWHAIEMNRRFEGFRTYAMTARPSSTPAPAAEFTPPAHAVDPAEPGSSVVMPQSTQLGPTAATELPDHLPMGRATLASRLSRPSTGQTPGKRP